MPRAKIGAIALALCLAAVPAFAQNESSGSGGATAAPDGSVTIQQAPASPVDDPPAAADPAPAQDQDARQDARPAARPSGPVPSTLTVPAGAVISVRVNQWLSSDRNRPGDSFSAVIEQPLVADGWVVARRGQSVIGRVSVSQKAGRGKDVAQLGVELSDLTLVDGQQLPVNTQLVQNTGRPTSNGRDAATIGATTIIGAAIGAAAGGGTGAAIGAGVGATAGATGVVLGSHGSPAVIAPEALLTFRLEAPLEVSTERSELAFRPVTQGDYDRPDRDQDAYGRRNVRGGPGGGPGYPVAAYPSSPYYYDYYGYPYGWGYYPPVYLGIYGGFGPRFYYGPRGGFRGGFRR
jgi:hypothetical protein